MTFDEWYQKSVVFRQSRLGQKWVDDPAVKNVLEKAFEAGQEAAEALATE